MAEFPDTIVNPAFSARYGLPAGTQLTGPPIQGTILSKLPGTSGGPMLAYDGPWPPPPDTAGKDAPPPTGTATPPPEGAHKVSEYRVTSLAPSVELTNNQPVPYGITATAEHDTLYSPNVNYRGTAAMRLSSRITTNTGDEPANGRKGVVSGAQGGMAAPITASSIVRINGSQAIRHGDRFEMNKASVNGPGNTVGEGRLVRDAAPRAAPADERSWWQRTKDAASAAAQAVGDFDSAHGHVLTRGVGALQAVGGGIEAVGGVVGGVLTAETGVGAVVGGAVALNGADNFQAGLRTLWTGEGTRTVTQTAVGSGIRAVGGSETTAAIGEAVAGLGPGGVRSAAALPGRLARIGRAAEEVPAVTRAAEAAPGVARAAEEAGSTTAVVRAEEAGAAGVRVTQSGYAYIKDALGRTVSVRGRLRLKAASRDPKIQRSAGGADRLATDQGGHLVGSRFDGPSDLINTVAQNQNLNQGAWKAMENSWARALADGKTVDVNIVPNYVGESLRPSIFSVRYWINGERYTSSFENQAGQAFGRH